MSNNFVKHHFHRGEQRRLLRIQYSCIADLLPLVLVLLLLFLNPVQL